MQVYTTMSNETVIVACSLVLAGAGFLTSKLIGSTKPTSNPSVFESELQSTVECEPDHNLNPPRYRPELSYSRFTSDPTLYRVNTAGPGIPRYVYSYVHRCYVTNDDYLYDMGL